MGDFTNKEIIVLGFLLGMILLNLIMLILMIVTRSQMKKMKRKHAALMNGLGVGNLEDVIIQIQSDMNQVKSKQSVQEQNISTIRALMQKMKAKMGIIRYSAFAEHGSDLSFSVAIIDELKNGMVLSGIHSREDHIMYAKPLQNGESKYPLTPEEKEAINHAVKAE